MPKRPFGVAQLRQLVRERVDETSIRAVAEELGMSPSGLHVFLKGSRPHPATLKKIADWASAKPDDIIDVRDVDAALTLLGAHVRNGRSSDERTKRLEEITRRLRSESTK